MKKLIFTIQILFIFSVCNGQTITDYPFKTFLDNDNNLYVTGHEQIGNSKDLYIAKYPPINGSGYLWKYQIPNPAGDDRGLDIKVDENGNVFATGYTFSENTNSNKVVIISLNSDGTENWVKFINYNNDGKGIGIDISLDNFGEAENVFITGYITNPTTGKDIIVKKLDATNGDSLWQSVYTFPGEQVATDILLDAGHAYIVGYTIAENETTSDIIIQSYGKQYGGLQDNLTYLKPGSNERPTGFCIPFPSDDPISKSRSAVTSLTDELVNSNVRTSYLTVCFDPDLQNELNPRWSRQTNVDNEFKENIPTDITSDSDGNIYVTGYMYNPMTGAYGDFGYDFASVKYSGAAGNNLWDTNPLFINYNDTSNTGVDDKATSIKVNNMNQVFLAGTSQGSPNGYSIAVIEQKNLDPVQKYMKAFVPNFLSDGRTSANLNKRATLELTSDGTPIMVVMGWNENEAYWAAVKYDEFGNEEYTINNDPESTTKAITKTSDKIGNTVSIKNYPNPFNPTTNLEFGISELGFVSLKIYDMMGREVVTLVNENKNAGSYSVKFDGSNLSSGIYYYTLNVDGIRVETKSMVLMK